VSVPAVPPLLGPRSPSSALTLQKPRQPLRSWGSALPGAEVFASSINLNEMGKALKSVCPEWHSLLGPRSPSSALTLQKPRQPLRSWGSALPSAEVFASSINLNEMGKALKSVCPEWHSLLGPRSPSSALTLQKPRQPLRSWGSALPGTEVFVPVPSVCPLPPGCPQCLSPAARHVSCLKKQRSP